MLAVFRRFFLTGLPPLVGLRGANVRCETNSFSVGKRLKSGPYSLSTTCTVSTPMASMLVKSTPLIRYRASRIGSSPRFLMAFAFCGFFTSAVVDSSRNSSRCIAVSLRNISRS